MELLHLQMQCTAQKNKLLHGLIVLYYIILFTIIIILHYLTDRIAYVTLLHHNYDQLLGQCWPTVCADGQQNAKQSSNCMFLTRNLHF